MTPEGAGWGVAIDGGWFDEERHLYRCSEGVIRPSATQVFDLLGMSDFSAIDEETLNWKRTYGNAVHVGAQLIAEGDLNWDDVDDAIIDAVTGIEQFLKKYEFEFEAAEERKIRTLCGMKFGTTLDLRGSIMYHGQRRRVLIDWKTGTKYSPTWPWQLGSYYVEQPQGNWIGVVGQVKKDGVVTPYWVQDLEKAKQVFQVLLAAANLKLNAGLAKVGK